MHRRMKSKKVEVFFLVAKRFDGIIETTFRGFSLGDVKAMHTVEIAVVLPLLLLVLLGGIFLSFQSVTLVGKQNQCYEATTIDSKSCTDVLRITEVVYETIEQFTKP